MREREEKKGSSRVIALLTQDAVSPYGGMERQIPADVEMEWWTGFRGWMSRWLWVFIHMSFSPLCECKRFYWSRRVVASSHIWDLFPACEPVCSLRSSSAFGLQSTQLLAFFPLYSYFSTWSQRFGFKVLRLFLRQKNPKQNSKITQKRKLPEIEGYMDRQMDVCRVGLAQSWRAAEGHWAAAPSLVLHREMERYSGIDEQKIEGWRAFFKDEACGLDVYIQVTEP